MLLKETNMSFFLRDFAWWSPTGRRLPKATANSKLSVCQNIFFQQNKQTQYLKWVLFWQSHHLFTKYIFPRLSLSTIHRIPEIKSREILVILTRILLTQNKRIKSITWKAWGMKNFPREDTKSSTAKQTWSGGSNLSSEVCKVTT